MRGDVHDMDEDCGGSGQDDPAPKKNNRRLNKPLRYPQPLANVPTMNNATQTAPAATKSMSTKEAAAMIRRSLRIELGAKRGDVSVRIQSYSGGSSIHVTVKSADIRFADVKRIAMAAQHISRCEMTGEILGGGNLYIHVEHHSDTRKALLTPVRDVLSMLAVGAQARSGSWIAQRLDDFDFIAWTGDSDPIRCWGIDHAAYQFALAMRGDAF